MSDAAPVERQRRLELVTCSAEETARLGQRLGGLLAGGATIGLVGELGSGKTTFTRGLVRGLGSPDADRVNSPTYVLEQVYRGRVPIHHFDAFRLAGADELRALGFEEPLRGAAVVVVEWADRVVSLLPEDRLLVELAFRGARVFRTDERAITFQGQEDRWGQVLAELAEPQRAD